MSEKELAIRERVKGGEWRVGEGEEEVGEGEAEGTRIVVGDEERAAPVLDMLAMAVYACGEDEEEDAEDEEEEEEGGSSRFAVSETEPADTTYDGEAITVCTATATASVRACAWPAS